jgi:hypothetical protein
VVPFDNAHENNRTALLLVNGVVYCAFASLEDRNPYHGWVLGYAPNLAANTLSQVAVFNATPNGGQGGIWSVGGLAADSDGNLYLQTGNGAFNGSANFGDSMIKLATAGGVLQPADFFTPFDQNTMNSQDLDLGSGGPLVVPDQAGTAHPHLLIGGGKTGTIYVVDRDNMGHFNAAGDTQIVQKVTGQAGEIQHTPAFWNNHIYVSSENANLLMYTLANGLLSTSPTSTSSVLYGYGESPVVSSNGNINGILWITQHMPGADGVLRAYDATNLGHELYNSNQNATRDQIGSVPTFGTAVAINGRVYLSTKDLNDSQAKLFIFGLL